MARYEVWQDGMCVAAVEGSLEHAVLEGMRYLDQYAQDGGAVLYKVAGKKRSIAAMKGRAVDLIASMRLAEKWARDGGEAGR